MIRNHSKLGQELTLEGWCLYLACPTGTSHWDKHNLSQWDRQIGTSCACPVGQAQLVPTGTGKGQKRPLLVPKRPLLVPWDKSYIHAGGLSLSWDKLYTHDGACPSSTCPNLSHKVGLQGRATFAESDRCSSCYKVRCLSPMPPAVLGQLPSMRPSVGSRNPP